MRVEILYSYLAQPTIITAIPLLFSPQKRSLLKIERLEDVYSSVGGLYKHTYSVRNNRSVKLQGNIVARRRSVAQS